MTIDVARSLADLADLHSLRQSVFERELGIPLPPFTASDDSYVHLLARDGDHGNVIAGVTILETTGEQSLHRRYGLTLPSGARVGRLTRMAVLPRWRRRRLPIRLVLSAQRLFIAPRGIQYTWLLYDAQRAEGTDLCRLLGYRALPQTVWAEYGQCRALVRDESAGAPAPAHQAAADWLSPAPELVLHARAS
jgi:hypothetical protein